MDLLHGIRVFQAVVETGSFTAAAGRLALSAPMASRAVAELESHLGARLLHRSTRRTTLTETGRAYYERTRDLLAELDEVDASVRAASVHPRGRLRVNAALAFGVRHLAPVLPEFMRRYADLEVDLTLTDRVVDLIEDGVDVAIRIGRLLPSSYVARPIAPVRLITCASLDYLERHGRPVRPEDLGAHRCLSYSYATEGDLWEYTRGGETVAVRVSGPLRANNGDALRDAALAGLGIVLQQDFLVGPDTAGGRLVALLEDWAPPAGGIHAIYPSRRHLSAGVRAFVDFLVERFAPRPGL